MASSEDKSEEKKRSLALQSRKESIEKTFKLIYGGLADFKGYLDQDLLPSYTEVTSQMKILEDLIKDLLVHQTSNMSDLSTVTEDDLPDTVWEFLGEGSFGAVYKVRFEGSDSAVKFFTSTASSKLRQGDDNEDGNADEEPNESILMRGLSHDNVIAYRGTGFVSKEKLETLTQHVPEDCGDSVRFIIMEYIVSNLDSYVERSMTPEEPGLRLQETWIIGQKVANALNYLHSKDIAHRDLKPDNILYDSGKRLVKVADFGLAWKNDFVNTQYTNMSGSARSSGRSGTGYKHVRWGPPELFEEKSKDVPSIERYKRADIWCYGMILAYLITGQKPFAHLQSADIERTDQEGTGVNPIRLPPNLPTELKTIVDSCRQIKPEDRVSAQRLLGKYDTEMKEKFLMAPEEKEFFSCGFLEKTDIFVADSCVSELTEGYFRTHVRPEGYRHDFLLCAVKTEKAPYHDTLPSDEWDLHDLYLEKMAEFKKKAKNKEIDDNPFVALKKLTIARPGAEEIQLLQLEFVESTYCHHRAMREIWIRGLTQTIRHTQVPCKAIVHPFYSTSFGLHVAILTNEGPGNPQKFIFCRRARRAGVSSPGVLTCGAVESCSVNDFVDSPDGSGKRVDLVKTAARGLHEELGLRLTGSDIDAITLNTVYLKFDNHEWGMCGYIDLADERVSPEHRISAQNLEARFLGGARDKFEHDAINPIDFELQTMVDFVYEKHLEFASSTKLVVVKVMQAFFGVDAVQKAFELKGE